MPTYINRDEFVRQAVSQITMDYNDSGTNTDTRRLQGSLQMSLLLLDYSFTPHHASVIQPFDQACLHFLTGSFRQQRHYIHHDYT